MYLCTFCKYTISPSPQKYHCSVVVFFLSTVSKQFINSSIFNFPWWFCITDSQTQWVSHWPGAKTGHSHQKPRFESSPTHCIRTYFPVILMASSHRYANEWVRLREWGWHFCTTLPYYNPSEMQGTASHCCASNHICDGRSILSLYVVMASFLNILMFQVMWVQHTTAIKR